MCCSLVCSQICLVMTLCLSLLGVYCFTFLQHDDHTPFQISDCDIWDFFHSVWVVLTDKSFLSLLSSQSFLLFIIAFLTCWFWRVLTMVYNAWDYQFFWTLSIVCKLSNLTCSNLLFPHHSAILWKILLCVPLGVLCDFFKFRNLKFFLHS